MEEEKIQLELIKLIEDSTKGLEPFKDSREFLRFNEILKKEVKCTQWNLKFTKQSKFKIDQNDWETGKLFNLTTRQGHCRSR